MKVLLQLTVFSSPLGRLKKVSFGLNCLIITAVEYICTGLWLKQSAFRYPISTRVEPMAIDDCVGQENTGLEGQ